MNTLDAKGNKPTELTSFEKKWRESLENGAAQKRYDALRERQALPLKEKLQLTEDRIRVWYEAFDGKVAISYSGGVDSKILLYLVRRIYPEVPAVFCNTGLEYPEILHLVKRTPNVRVMRPKMPFHRVIRVHGWPVISKKVARGLSVLRNPTDNNQNIYRLYEEGINRFGEPVNGFKVPMRWKFLVKAPFPISDKCCEIMKKEPMHRYEKETGRVQFVGMMASDSKTREKTYIQTGCNAFDAAHPRSTPLAFWNKQDIMKCLRDMNIPYAKVYGDIVTNPSTGQLEFTGVQSTGCVFCCFGLSREDIPNRFQKLYDTHPRLWDYCMNKLGLADVLEYIREYCPDRSIKGKFRGEPTNQPTPVELFQ